MNQAKKVMPSIAEIMAMSKKEQLNALYERFDEGTRLNHSKSAKVEYLTTMHYIEKYMFEGMRVLDIGAGAGEYSISLAQLGYQVHSVEYARPNVEKLQAKVGDLPILLTEGDARDLTGYHDQMFDLVLLMGPLYHLHEEADRMQALLEAIRVLKVGGVILIAFIANDMIPLTELMYRQNFFSEDTYDHNTFKVFDVPFVFMTLEEMRKTIDHPSLSCLHEVAVDGLSELMADRINSLPNYDYDQYLKYHLYHCEKPEHLGKTNHTLFVMKKVK